MYKKKLEILIIVAIYYGKLSIKNIQIARNITEALEKLIQTPGTNRLFAN